MRIRNQRLPIGYREVEYLESTGTQWIDSNVSIAAKTSMKCKVIWTNISGNYPMLYGAWAVFALSSMPSQKLCIASGGYSGNNPWSSGPTISANVLYEITHLPNKLTINEREYTIPNASASNTANDRHVLLFAASNTGNTPYNWSTYAKARVYYFKLYNDTTIVRNFVPCIRTSDSKPGLYDTINSTFYTNAGTGEFLYGSYHDSYNVAIYPRLPSAYQEVEYIGMSGAQQINTGMKFDMQNGACEITYQASTTSQNGMLLASNSGNYFWLYYYSNANRANLYVYANGQKNIQGNILDLNKHTVLYKNRSMFVDGVTRGSFAVTLSTTSTNLIIGSYDGNYFFQGKIFDCKIWDGNYKLVRHFIPCYRKSDSVIGLFDIVNQQFYTNSGTGTFTKGSNVSYIQNCSPKITLVPSAYQEVEYIASSGTQYIDLGFKANNDIGIYLRGSTTNTADQIFIGHASKFQLGSNGGSEYYGWNGVNTAGGSRIPIGSGNVFTNELNYLNSRKSYFNGTLNNNLVLSYATISESTYNVTLFCRRESNGTLNYYSKLNLYELKISKGKELKYHFIPCYRKSDSVIGLWEAIEGKFYTNAGTGTFTKGSNKYTII